MLGYETPSFDYPRAALDTSIIVDQLPQIKDSVHIWLYISVEPKFLMPKVNTNCLESSELKEVRDYLSEWCVQAKHLYFDRFIEPLVCTLDGKRICLTRLVDSIPLPVDTDESPLEIACRYVSLLNVFKTFDSCTGLSGVWLNNQV